MKDFEERTKEVLEKLESTSKEFWNISRDSANFLNMLIKMTNRRSVLEIGTSNGYSGIWLAKALKETKGKMITIEFWEKRRSIALENFRICGVDDIIESKQGSAIDVIDNLTDVKFDFVFIDANKGEYIKYLNHLTENGMITEDVIIVADNIISHKEKVKEFVYEIENNINYQSEILDIGSGLLLAIKK